MAHESRAFESITDITPADVKWLKDGCSTDGYYLRNNRVVYYKTKRGVAKAMTCYKQSNGFYKYRSYSTRGPVKDGLTNEEMAVFEPEWYQAELEAKKERKAMRDSKPKTIIKVGDIFKGSYGYEAWIHEYFEVVEVSKTGKSVVVREVAQERESTGYCEWQSRPIKGKFVGKMERHTLNFDGTPSFRVNSFERAYLHTDIDKWDNGYNYH